ncbi:4Fe-4S dicluster domain-containing protein [bacterium]|jgi:tetrathionate reductase subunit B|nr:4Fe-4S dicluster domain-containing protein [bacterium]
MKRREFLEKCAKAATGAGLMFSGVAVNVSASAGLSKSSKKLINQDGYDWNKHYYGMVVNPDKCIGCYSCMRACSDENDVQDRGFRTWVERYTITKDDKVIIESPKTRDQSTDKDDYFQLPPSKEPNIERQFFVPKLCNHCTDAPCTQVCPVGATYKTNDGVVLIDHPSCVGCGYCIQSCPYGARFWDTNYLCANKCSFCYHRVTKGLNPACVDACPTGARVFGDLKDPESAVVKAIREGGAKGLKRSLGTKPKVFYKNLSQEVV